jgi:hypothetical protein
MVWVLVHKLPYFVIMCPIVSVSYLYASALSKYESPALSSVFCCSPLVCSWPMKSRARLFKAAMLLLTACFEEGQGWIVTLLLIFLDRPIPGWKCEGRRSQAMSSPKWRHFLRAQSSRTDLTRSGNTFIGLCGGGGQRTMKIPPQFCACLGRMTQITW